MIGDRKDMEIEMVRSALAETLPPLPETELREFVWKFFEHRELYLRALGEHASPLYVLEPYILEDRARQFKEAFDGQLPATEYYYAVKSNNHPDVARQLLDQGFGLDVSGAPELDLALSLGAEKIVFSGPGKTQDELRLAVTHADRVTVLIDSFGELSRLEEAAASQARKVTVGVRLTTNPEGLWRKFGIPLDSLQKFFEAAGSCSHVRLRGIQFHTSWNLTPHTQASFLGTFEPVMKALPKAYQDQIEFIDIGGGYWPSQGEWLQAAGTHQGSIRQALGQEVNSASAHYRLPATPLSDFADKLCRAIDAHISSVKPCRICFEPGRWICNDAMHLLLTVVDKKASDLAITDAGTNAIGWERFEVDYFPILNLSRPSLDERPCLVLGSLCTPHDVWGYAYFGEDIREGDILMIPTQGAYTYSLGQNFIKPLPRVVAI